MRAVWAERDRRRQKVVCGSIMMVEKSKCDLLNCYLRASDFRNIRSIGSDEHGPGG